MTIFKVCDVSRQRKAYISLPDVITISTSNIIVHPHDSDNVFNNLLREVNRTLGIRGTKIVLESNGVVVNGTEALVHLQDEILMVLQHNQRWTRPRNNNCQRHFGLTKEPAPTDYIFKMCNSERTKKVFVSIPNTTGLFVNLLKTASEELQVNGKLIVLEKDGTVIAGGDKDTVLLKSVGKVMMVVGEEETWTPPTESMYMNISARK